MTRRHMMGSAGALTMLTLVLTGCTAKGHSPVATRVPTSTSTSATKPGTGATKPGTSATKSSPTPLVQHSLPATVANEPAMRKNVAVTSCAAIPGGWRAAGTVANTGETSQTYTIVVYFTTEAATVLDFATTKVTVPAHSHTDWQAQASFAAPKQMLCPVPGISTT